MRYEIRNKNNGFIALISVIVVSAILLLIAVTLSFSQFYDRYNILESEYKERSASLAEACVDSALLELANNINYLGDATTTIGANKCYVGNVTTSGPNKIFKTRATYQNSYTDLKIVIDSSTFSIQSWEEIPNF